MASTSPSVIIQSPSLSVVILTTSPLVIILTAALSIVTFERSSDDHLLASALSIMILTATPIVIVLERNSLGRHSERSEESLYFALQL